MNELKQKLIVRFWKYLKHLEFIWSDEWLLKYWENRDSIYNIWEYNTNKLEFDIELLD